MVTKEMLEDKLSESGIKCNILLFENYDTFKQSDEIRFYHPDDFWFAYTFDLDHTEMVDPHEINYGEDDYLGGAYRSDDNYNADRDNLNDAIGYIKEHYEIWQRTGEIRS